MRTNPMESSRPRRGTPSPAVSNVALAGLPACGVGHCPSNSRLPNPIRDQWPRASLRSRSRGRLLTQIFRFEPYRIPSSPVVGQEPAQSHHLPKATTCQAEGPGQMTSEQDAALDADTVCWRGGSSTSTASDSADDHLAELAPAFGGQNRQGLQRNRKIDR